MQFQEAAANAANIAAATAAAVAAATGFRIRYKLYFLAETCSRGVARF
jgi:hypothetical protein